MTSNHRPRDGKLLSPERWNPQTSIFYEELVIVSNTFVQELNRYLARPLYERFRLENPEFIKNWGIGYFKVKNVASGFTKMMPRDAYDKMASSFQLNIEVDPSMVRVRGLYNGMLLAYFFDQNGIDMETAKERMRQELAEADADIARNLQNGNEQTKKHAYLTINMKIADILTGRKGGGLSLRVVTSYEHEVVAMLNLEGISREELREAFKGDIETLEERLRFVPYKLFEVGNRSYTLHAHNVGERIITPYGGGIVTTQEPLNPNKPELGDMIMVTLNNGGTRKLISNKYKGSNPQPK